MRRHVRLLPEPRERGGRILHRVANRPGACAACVAQPLRLQQVDGKCDVSRTAEFVCSRGFEGSKPFASVKNDDAGIVIVSARATTHAHAKSELNKKTTR